MATKAEMTAAVQLVQDPGAADDAAWFDLHRDRRAHIRKPHNREHEKEFLSLGPHEKHRRRIISYRSGHPMMPLARIPFLLFADETVEDRDDVLLPIIDEVMRDAAKEYGIEIPSVGARDH